MAWDTPRGPELAQPRGPPRGLAACPVALPMISHSLPRWVLGSGDGITLKELKPAPEHCLCPWSLLYSISCPEQRTLPSSSIGTRLPSKVSSTRGVWQTTPDTLSHAAVFSTDSGF